MLVEQLNLNLFRVFAAVFEQKSMTKAAGSLFMTQSGVSQNIKTLEDFLGLVLFDRIKQRLVPTTKAKFLYENCKSILTDLDRTLIDVTGREDLISGEVTIGLPLEFGNNIILPIISQMGNIYPGVSFKIKYGYATEFNKLLLTGELDFAFIDSYGVDPQIKTKEVISETLCLVCSTNYLSKFQSGLGLKFFQKLDYVDYEEGAPVLNLWLRHHLKVKHDLKLRIRASLMDVQGMSRVISEGLGAGILPLHVVRRLEREGHKLHIFNENKRPLKNTISLALLDGRTHIPAVNIMIENILESLSKLKQDSQKK